VPLYGYVIVALGSLAWLLPFLLQRQKAQGPRQLDTRARWGLLLLAIGYSLLWQGSFWKAAPQFWRVVGAIGAFGVASIVCWASVHALGRQWRIDASLNEDHELVRSGVYGVVRHPIYCSMGFAFLGTGLILTPWVLLAAAAVAFVVGTAIRVRLEDALLARRFGAAFEAYRQAVPASVPLPWR
jgi:protein-S-isoprenylcysteine O-methyltransferase Ste14